MMHLWRLGSKRRSSFVYVFTRSSGAMLTALISSTSSGLFAEYASKNRRNLEYRVDVERAGASQHINVDASRRRRP